MNHRNTLTHSERDRVLHVRTLDDTEGERFTLGEYVANNRPDEDLVDVLVGMQVGQHYRVDGEHSVERVS
jgi:hypothetical protein